MIRIKVCGMRDADNIRRISALNPDYMGFIFYPGSRRYVGANYEMVRDIPDEIGKVGVFVNEHISKMIEIAIKCRLNIIQLHGSESPEVCWQLKTEGFKVIKACGIHSLFDFTTLEDYSPVCDFFLFDTKSNTYGGSGEKFDKDLIDMYTLPNPFFFSGGISPEDCEYVSQINHSRFYAVDINSRFETKPGIKDPHITSHFIQKIRNLSFQ